ncbi:MAG: AAA family ATPase [Tunicatimonas sp.]
MYLQKVHLQNFKRFTDLTIDLEQPAKPYRLVLLIGANGSGKSSVFDAFEVCSYIKTSPPGVSSGYYEKNNQPIRVRIDTTNGKYVERRAYAEDTHATSGGDNFLSLESFYGRSSLRQVPRLTRTTLGQNKEVDIQADTDRPRTYVDRDERFENDLEMITRDILRYIYKSDQEKQVVFDSYIQPINEAFERIFEGQEDIVPKLLSIIPPLDGNVAEVQFHKGEVEFHYDLLSSGEKEIFNILINLLSRRPYYQDTVYFLDEIDLHLNTRLQYNLLREIIEHWLPGNCQLWTASHALGFIDYANDYERAAIIDFDALDFDKPQVIHPSPKNSFDVFEVAVDQAFLAKVFEGKKIFFAENTDAGYYNNIYLENTIFFTAKDKNDVFYKSKNTNYLGLIDRDFLTDEEVLLIGETYPDLFVLDYYSIENYFYHPDNLAEYYEVRKKSFTRKDYTDSWLKVKKEERDDIILRLVSARQSYPFFRENTKEASKKLDDFKSKESAKALISLLDSQDFETFYRVLPAKDVGKTIPERANLNKQALGQTDWFKQQIQNVTTNATTKSP